MDVSVLEHILDGAQTMPESQGVFLAETWRFGSLICGYTSEVYYEGRLRPTTARQLEEQRLVGGAIEGAGLFVLDVSHEGNRRIRRGGSGGRHLNRQAARGELKVD